MPEIFKNKWLFRGMHRLLGLVLAIALLASPVMLASPVNADGGFPQVPAIFEGSVSISGSAAPIGTSIVATINSVTCGTSTTTIAGSYEPMLINNGNEGDTIQFYVNSVAAQTGTYHSGSLQPLNLSTGSGGSAPAAPVLSSPSNGATGTSTTPTLQWAASSGATSYGVQVSTSTSFSSITFSQSGITSTQVTVSPALSAGTTYYWRANATNASGTSAYSGYWSFTTLATPAPSAPVLSSPSNGATGLATSPTLVWIASSGATSYGVQVSTSTSFSSITYSQSGITSTQITVYPALSAGTTYYWRVNATNAGGTSSYSSYWSFTTASGGGGDIPSMPSFYQGVAYTNGAAANQKQVCAIVNGTSTCATTDISGNYFLMVNGIASSTVTFTVNGATATETSIFQPGWMNALNLHAGTGTLTVVTNSATYATTTTATLSGSISAWSSLDTSATTWLGYSSTSGGPYTYAAATPSSMTGTGTFTTTLSGLTVGNTYYIMAKATGTTSGDKLGSQITYVHSSGGVLTVVTNSATYATATTATLSGSISAWNSADTSATTWLGYSSTSGGPYTYAAATPSSLTGTGSFTTTLSGLTVGNTYYIMAKATGTTSGDKLGTQVTYVHSSGGVLTVVTNGGTYATATTATLSGSISAWNSADTSATTWLGYSSTSGGPYTYAAATPSSLTGTGSFTTTLSGLTVGNTYYIMAKATGTTSGDKLGTQVTYIHSSSSCGSDPVGCTVGTMGGRVGKYVVMVGRFRATSTTSITRINVQANVAGGVKAAIYSDDSGSIGTKLAGSETLVSGNSVPIASTAITSGNYYWLAAWSDTSSCIGMVSTAGSGNLLLAATSSSYTFPTTMSGYFDSYPYQALISGN